jgi:hypothetical protein
MFYKFQQKYLQLVEMGGAIAMDAGPAEPLPVAGSEAQAYNNDKSFNYYASIAGKITQKPKKKKGKPYFPAQKQNKLPKSVFGVVRRNKTGM